MFKKNKNPLLAIHCMVLLLILTPLSALAEKSLASNMKLEDASYKIFDTDEPGVKKYVMEANLKATPDQVCGLVCDYYKMNTYMPKEFDSKVVKQESNQITLDLTLDLPWPFEDLKSVLLIDVNKEKGNARWKLIEGNVRRNDGIIQVEKRGVYSHLIQTTYIDIGRNYPDWFIKIYSRTLTYKVMRAIRNQLETPSVVFTKKKEPAPLKP